MSKSTLANCYVLKVFTMIMAVVAISITYSAFWESYRYLSLYSEISGYKDYGFLQIEVEEKDPDIVEETRNKIISKCYSEGKVGLAVSKFSDDVNDYFVVNQATLHNVRGIDLRKMKDGDSDLFIYFPAMVQDSERTIEDAVCSTSAFLGIDQLDVTYQARMYSSKMEVLYFDWHHYYGNRKHYNID